MGVTVGALKSRLHRARETLARQMSGHRIEPALHRCAEHVTARPYAMVI